MKRIGFIGTGVMGKEIVLHLLNANYEVNVYSRTKSKTDELIAKGAIWRDSPADIAQDSDVIFTMVGFPSEVESVYFGESGIFSIDLLTGKILVDLSTSRPSLARKIYSHANEQGAYSLDAPVSGGDLGAKKGTLTIMVGGDENVYNNVLNILSVFSSKVNLQGPSGSGQHTKMANQIMIAGTMTGMTELLVYSKAAGLSLEKVLDTVSGGSAANWSLDNYAPRILKEDYTPGFFASLFLKDLDIALEEAEKMNIDLPATKEARRLYNTLVDHGFGDSGTQSLIKLWWQD